MSKGIFNEIGEFDKFMFKKGYNKALDEVEKIFDKIKLTNPDYTYSNDYIESFLRELKQQLKEMREK